MKPLFTFLLIFTCLFAKAQYSPETATRLLCSNNYSPLPFSNIPAIAGLNYGCLTVLSNSTWSYFTICDTGSAQINFMWNSTPDTMEFVVYGPFSDTINITSQLQTATIVQCQPYWPFGPPAHFSALCSKGIYYMVMGASSNTSIINASLDVSIFGSNPVSNDAYCNTNCSICNTTTSLFQELCTIDLDATTQRNKLVWEKGDTTNVNGYVIYRENSIATQYDSLDYIPVTSLSEYIDMTANPATRAWRYKMSAIDNCSNIPDINTNSDRYTTIFLQQGVSTLNSINLSWNSGNVTPRPGNDGWIPSYFIYRGNSLNNMILIDSVPSQISNYTDINPSPGANYYQIEMRKTAPCVSSMLPTYTRSGSNFIATVFTGITEIKPELRFTVQPNPATDHVSVVLNSDAKNLTNTISILSIEGKKLGSYPVTSFPQEINTSDLSDGIYILQLENEKGVSRQNIVIQ